MFFKKKNFLGKSTSFVEAYTLAGMARRGEPPVRRVPQDDDEDEEYEILDLNKFDNRWIDKIFGDISKQTVAKQVVIGTGSGWVAGWLFMKVGKVAAASIGLTVLLVQVAQHQGYLTINWSKLEKNVDKARRQMEKSARKHAPGLTSNFRHFFRRNIILAGSFTGGFLMGLAF